MNKKTKKKLLTPHNSVLESRYFEDSLLDLEEVGKPTQADYIPKVDNKRLGIFTYKMLDKILALNKNNIYVFDINKLYPKATPELKWRLVRKYRDTIQYIKKKHHKKMTVCMRKYKVYVQKN